MAHWQQTYTGLIFDFENITLDAICIRDIAHSLALTNRYGGHSRYPISVALHSVLCSMAPDCPHELRRTALLHDAAEAYIGDITRPLIHAIPDIGDFFQETELAIAKKYGTSYPMPPEVAVVDNRMLMTEKGHALAAEPKDWQVNAKPYSPTEWPLVHDMLRVEMTWRAAESMFINRYIVLTGDNNADE